MSVNDDGPLLTREELLARVSDVLRRSGIEDAESLVRLLEQNLPPTLTLKTLVRTDGVYRTVNKFTEEAWKYIRFFDDGQVLTVTHSGQPAAFRNWRPDGNDSVGNYVITARKLRFDSVDQYGTVDYEGVVLDDGKLRLRWNSHINGNSGEDSYEFFPDDAA